MSEIKKPHKVLAVDLDATLADVQTVFMKLAKERFGVVAAYEDITHWDFWFQRIPKDEAWRIFRDIWVLHHDEVQATEDNIGSRLYQALGRGYEIAIITSTQKECLPFAIRWLDKHGIPYKSITGLYNAQSKYDYPWNAIIDDNPKIAKDACRFPERQVFLRDQPWNREVASWCVKRVRTFDEMVQELE